MSEHFHSLAVTEFLNSFCGASVSNKFKWFGLKWMVSFINPTDIFALLLHSISVLETVEIQR